MFDVPGYTCILTPPPLLSPFPTLLLWLCIPATNHRHVYCNPRPPFVPTHLLYTQLPPPPPPPLFCPFLCPWLCIPATSHCHVYLTPVPPPPPPPLSLPLAVYSSYQSLSCLSNPPTHPPCLFLCPWLCIPATNHCHVYLTPPIPHPPTLPLSLPLAVYSSYQSLSCLL